MTTIQPRQLFGGAIVFSLPPDWHDASDMRQVPDNQEVFLSHEVENTSVIFEILQVVREGQAADNLYEAAKYHFASIANDNASLSTKVLTPPPPEPIPPVRASVSSAAELANLATPPPVVVTGTQTIHKFSHDPSGGARPGHEGDVPDEVWIGLALWRVDVALPDGKHKRADVVCTANVRISSPGGTEELAKVEEWWTRAVVDMRIKDWALFADE